MNILLIASRNEIYSEERIRELTNEAYEVRVYVKLVF